jgi:hypothetical protein
MAYGTLKADSIVYDNSGSDVALTVSTIPTGASPTFTGNVTINGQGDLRLADSDSSNYVGFQAPGTVSSNVLWTLPGADGSAGQQLTTDGSGTLSWSAAVNVQAASLTGTTMASGVVTSSLTTVGTLTGLTIDGDVTFTGASSNGTWDKSADAFVGNLTGTASTATEATNVTVTANNSTNETVYPLFVDGATGTQGAETDTGLSYNPSSGQLTATKFVGAATALDGSRTIGGVVFDNTGNIDLPGVNTAGNQNTSGTAALATEFTVTANNSTDETVYPLFADGNTGSQGAETDTGLTYNPSSGLLTSTGFVGNVTGNCSGTAATVTGAAQTAITSVGTLTALTTSGLLTVENNAPKIKLIDSDATGTPEAMIDGSGGDLVLEVDKDDEKGTSLFKIKIDGSQKMELTGGGNASFTGSVTDSKGDVRSVPTRNETSAYTLVAADAGKCITADNGVTVPNGVFSAGDVITIVNMATSDKVITQGSSLTMRNTGDDGNTGNVTVKKYAMCTLIFTSSSVCFFSTTAKA